MTAPQIDNFFGTVIALDASPAWVRAPVLFDRFNLLTRLGHRSVLLRVNGPLTQHAATLNRLVKLSNIL